MRWMEAAWAPRVARTRTSLQRRVCSRKLHEDSVEAALGKSRGSCPSSLATKSLPFSVGKCTLALRPSRRVWGCSMERTSPRAASCARRRRARGETRPPFRGKKSRPSWVVDMHRPRTRASRTCRSRGCSRRRGRGARGEEEVDDVDEAACIG